MAKNALRYEITAKDRSKQALRSVQNGLRATNKAANLLKTAIGGIAVGLAVRSLARFTNDSIKAADAIAKTADKVGVGVVALQQLRFAADLAGVGQEKLDSSLERFTKRIGEASQGTGEAKKALELLGVSFANADGKIRPTEAVLSAVADAMASVESPAQRAALAAQLFGREGVGLVNLLKGGSAGLRDFAAQATAAGVVLSEDLVRAAEVLNDKLTRSNKALFKAKTAIGLAFAQSGIIELFTKAVQKLARVMSDPRFIRKFRDGLKLVERSLRFVGRNLEDISKGFLIVFGYFVIKRISLVAIAITKFAKVIIASGIAMTVLRAISSKVGLGLLALGGTFGIAFAASETFRQGVFEATQDLDNFLGVSEMVTGANAALDRVLGVTKDSFDDLGKQIETTGGAFLFSNQQTDKLKKNLDDVSKSALTAFGSGAAAGVKDYFEGIRDQAANAKTFVTSAFKSLQTTLSDFFYSGDISFQNFADNIKRGLADIAAKGVISIAGSAAKGAITTIGNSIGSNIGSRVVDFFGFASGGYVGGAGGDRSDNIPAMLSPGEYVVNAASVRKYGAGFFGALNGNSRGPVETDSGLPGFGFGSFIKRAFKSVTKVIKKVAGFIVSGIKGTIDGLASGDPMAIAAIVSSFILPGVMTAVTGAMSAASAATAFGGVMGGQGLTVAASLAGQAASGVSAIATGITNGISRSFANGILGGSFSPAAVAQSLVSGQVSKLATGAVSSALGASGFDRGAAAQGLFNSGGEKYAESISQAFGNVVNSAEPFIDRRANGGPVQGGHPYLVGERGPEVFTPGRAGSVSPNMASAQIVDAVREVRDEMSALRRQFARALSGASLAGARA